MARKPKIKSSKLAWGVFWLLVAGLILANHLGGFVQLGVWSIVRAALALIMVFHCFVSLSFASLPIPLAALYYIFQAQLGWPFIAFWTLALVAVLVTCAFYILLPRRYGSRKHFVFVAGEGKKRKHYSEDDDDCIEGQIEEGDDENNPYISVRFGGASRYLRSACLETAELNCSFGALEVYFDNVKLSPDGAEVYVDCKFGAIEIYVPGHWRVIDDMSASLGSAEVSRRLQKADTDAPTMTIKGNVSLGSVEVSRIKGS